MTINFKIILTIGCMLVLALLTLPASAGEWELAKDKDDIQVFTKKSEGSKLKDSKVVSTFDASPEEVLKILLDIDTYPDWIPTCKESAVLKKVSEDEMFYYSEYKAPWPVANRDMIIHAKVSRNATTGVIVLEMTCAPDYIPVKDKIVRIPEFEGTWTLTPTADGKVDAVNAYHTHPGGNIPEFLANMTAVDNPFKMMTRLREKLAEN